MNFLIWTYESRKRSSACLWTASHVLWTHLDLKSCQALDEKSSTREFALLNKSKGYKLLHKLAKKILSVPATSSPVERIFSQSGFLFRQHRAKMSRKTLQMLTMLKCNKDLI